MVWVDTRGFRAGTRQKGKRRTEVTEATEGDWGWWTNALGSRSLAHVREQAKRKESLRGHGGNRGRLGLVDKCTWVKIVGSRAGTRQKGKASLRGHGGRRGGLGLVDKCTWVKIVGSRAGTPQRGKHRSEVTEGGKPLHPTGNGPPDTGTDTDTILGHGTQNQIDGVRNFPFGSTR
jgi:hypothetical protein